MYEETKAEKIASGVKYETTAGWEVVIHDSAGPNREYPVIASVLDRTGEWRLHSFTEYGVSRSKENPIRLHIKREIISGYVLIMENGRAYFYPGTNVIGTAGAIAQIPISFYKGQGL
jgi:hypothetical protein